MPRTKIFDEYQEGAKGHCYWCGRPEGEHKGGKCALLAERNDVAGRTAMRRHKKVSAKGACGIGLVR